MKDKQENINIGFVQTSGDAFLCDCLNKLVNEKNEENDEMNFSNEQRINNVGIQVD